jgi:energy-coupling factor transporter ATP-binding protein EcfA2
MIPEIDKTLTGYNFIWIEEKIRVQVSNLSFKHDNLKGEIKIKTSLPGFNEHLHQANFNFSSTRSKTELVKTLHGVCEEVEWSILIEQLRVKTLELYRQGEPLQILNPKEKIEKPEYLLYPFLPKNQMSLIYGEGGTGKSTLALFLSLLLMHPFIGPEYGLQIETPGNVLYLDFETSREVIQLQYSGLASNFNCNKKIYYRRCSLPLTHDLEKIKECVQESRADLIIVDSVGIACGDNINEAHTANLFALALRSLNTTNLLVSHTSKERLNNKTPFGSIYFFNNARNVWELRKIQETGEDEIKLGLFHRKSNMSKLNKPFGFKFIYGNSITVEKQDVSEIDSFIQELSISTRIKKLLSSEGVLDIKTIAKVVNSGEGYIRVALNRLRKKGEVIKQGDNWALLYHE